jgi:hypothetical protein
MSSAIAVEALVVAHDSAFVAARKVIEDALREQGIVVLPPMDVLSSIQLLANVGLRVNTTMLDPWYNKGVGGVRDDYKEYIGSILTEASKVSQHVYLWGFPEIVAYFVERVPEPLRLIAWLTWYYKNNPSVIRGWRSSQMACLHMAQPEAKLHPEHFLNDVQKEKLAAGKLRYMPGPTSVIEAPLNIGFVGRKEQTGHPAQKPLAVFNRLLEMTTVVGDLVFDPMSGAGTTGQAARDLERLAIICDHSEEYTAIAERRLGVSRVQLPL